MKSKQNPRCLANGGRSQHASGPCHDDPKETSAGETGPHKHGLQMRRLGHGQIHICLEEVAEKKIRWSNALEILKKCLQMHSNRNRTPLRHLEIVADTRNIGLPRKAEGRTQWTTKEVEEHLCVCIPRKVIGEIVVQPSTP